MAGSNEVWVAFETITNTTLCFLLQAVGVGARRVILTGPPMTRLLLPYLLQMHSNALFTASLVPTPIYSQLLVHWQVMQFKIMFDKKISITDLESTGSWRIWTR